MVYGIRYGSLTALLQKNGVWSKTCQHKRKEYIKHGTNSKGNKDAFWHIFFRIFCFLGGGGYSVKTYKGKKYYTGAGYHACPAMIPEIRIVMDLILPGHGINNRQFHIRGVCRDEVRMVICRIDILPSQGNEQYHDRHFQDYDNIVYGCGPLCTADQ